MQFRDPKSASDDVKEFGFGYIDDLELTDNSDIKAMFEYVTDRKRPGHHQWTPLQQGRFLRQVTALKEKLKAGWQAIPNCILAKHTHTHTHTHTHNSMQDEQKKEREVSVASDVTVLEMANVTPQSVACCRSPLAQPPLAPDNVESEAGAPLEPLTEFMASLQFRDPKSASDDVKEFGFGYIDDLELTDNSDIKAMFEYVTDRKRPGHHQWTPLQQGRFLRQVTALKEKLKAGWQAIPNCILAKHTHTHTHTHTHNSMQDEQKKEREVSVASYVTVLEMANITPQVKVAILKVLIEHETELL